LHTFPSSAGKIKLSLKLTRITGTVREVQYTFLIVPPAVLVGMRNVSDQSCRENQNTNFMFSNFTKIVPFLRLCEKNFVELGMPQMTM